MPVPKQKPAERLTLTALHNDWRKLAAFMGWPEDEREVRYRWRLYCEANDRDVMRRTVEAR